MLRSEWKRKRQNWYRVNFKKPQNKSKRFVPFTLILCLADARQRIMRRSYFNDTYYLKSKSFSQDNLLSLLLFLISLNLFNNKTIMSNTFCVSYTCITFSWRSKGMKILALLLEM